MFCHNKPLFRDRSKGLGRLVHSVYFVLKEAKNKKKKEKGLRAPRAKDNKQTLCCCTSLNKE